MGCLFYTIDLPKWVHADCQRRGFYIPRHIAVHQIDHEGQGYCMSDETFKYGKLPIRINIMFPRDRFDKPTPLRINDSRYWTIQVAYPDNMRKWWMIAVEYVNVDGIWCVAIERMSEMLLGDRRQYAKR